MTNDGTLLAAHSAHDMVAAITQETINYQLSQLFKPGHIHKTLDLKVQSGQGQPHTKPIDVRLQATLAAPTIEILDGADNARKVLFKLHLTSGTLSSSLTDDLVFPDDNDKNNPDKQWTYAFSVNLDLQAIEHDAVQNHTRIPDEVKQHLAGFSSEDFTIRHLFMDFQDSGPGFIRQGADPLPAPRRLGGRRSQGPGQRPGAGAGAARPAASLCVPRGQ